MRTLVNMRPRVVAVKDREGHAPAYAHVMPVKVRVRALSAPRPAPATLARRARRMLVALGLERAELSLVLCDDRTMRSLNRRHRGLDRSTDVLAFALAEGVPMPSPTRGP